ncbi:DUF3093 domain-containing protein [Cellulomonas sp. P22]|uniref:DUF3093 domain-containing protein n=1 Tax=Cellulomonas sp. P22 TaxID=3373189 RepID=UPI0037B2BB5E
MPEELTRPARTTFTERLWPGPLGWFCTLAAGGVIGAVFFPVSPLLAAVAGVATFVAALVFAVRTSPEVRVADGELWAGGAHIPLALLADAQPLDREQTRHAVGPGYDPRAYVVLRAWVGTAVRAEVRDPQDPTPCWIVSTRRPAELAAAIGTATR